MRWIVLTWIAISIASSSAVPSRAQDRSEATEPLDIGRVEKVDVQLVLLDVLALDRRDRTVPGLTLDQFELFVDTKRVQIASLDVDCPLGVAKDPRAGQSVEVPEPPAGAPPRRIVHAFDYFHMGDSVAWTLETAQEAIGRLARGGEEHMIVTIGSGLRIQVPFTSDLDEIDATLRRMYQDPGLYGGFYGRLTERPFYRRLASLIDFLELVDGPKIVLLYSGRFVADGFDHDPEFEQISAMAAKARVALYPVDAGGLRAPLRFRYGDLGGPKELARLAVETGGRATYHTNDLGLALARAQRDYGCRYTVGFYDTDPKPDEARRVSISIDKAGVRAIYPIKYVLRSEKKRLDSQVRTAGMVPAMYEDGGMAAAALALRPRSAGRWEVLIAALLPDAVLAQEAGAPWKIAGRVMTPSGAIVRKFKRDLAPSRGPVEDDLSRTLLESVTLKPGRYRASIVLFREGMPTPWAARADIELPAIPRNELFLVGPHLGRYAPFFPRATGAAEADAGPVWRFVPLIAESVRQGETVEVLTWICRVGENPAVRHATVERELRGDSGSAVGTFDPVRVELAEPERVSCHALLDAVPTSALEPGRYLLKAFLPGEEHRSQIAFDVTR